MIVKSISWKVPGFHQLLSYLSCNHEIVAPPLLHNLPVGAVAHIPAIEEVFLRNARHLPPRKNGVILYHEILSFAPADQKFLTPTIILDLARRYLELRAPEALACGIIHAEQPHPHIHIVISGNLLGQAKKLRLSRGEFTTVKRTLEAYQKERYPELRHSLVFEDTKRRLRSHDPLDPLETLPIPPAVLPPGGVREKEQKRRLTEEGRGAASRKELLRDRLLRILTCAASREAFVQKVQVAGIEVYSRGGRPYGVIQDGRKYRFTTLGISMYLADAETKWRQIPVRDEALAGARLAHTRRFIRSFGYAKDMLELLEEDPADPALRALRQNRRERRSRQREERFRSYRRGDRSPERSP